MTMKLVVAGTLISALAAGAALAQALNPVDCSTDPAEECRGTNKPDQIAGSTDRDFIYGQRGGDTINGGGAEDGDEIRGGKGDDTINDNVVSGDPNRGDTDNVKGGPGNDTINVREGSIFLDFVDCGPGRDTVFADARDTVAGNCERQNPAP